MTGIPLPFPMDGESLYLALSEAVGLGVVLGAVLIWVSLLMKGGD